MSYSLGPTEEVALAEDGNVNSTVTRITLLILISARGYASPTFHGVWHMSPKYHAKSRL